jgi:hypothetical protein
MSLFNKIRSLFRQDAPRALRNKPGGMAWINAAIDEGTGAFVLIGHPVRIVRLIDGDYWMIDPPQSYVLTSRTKFTADRKIYPAGSRITFRAVRDDCLTPWRDLGDEAQDESLWQPHDGEKKETA